MRAVRDGRLRGYGGLAAALALACAASALLVVLPQHARAAGSETTPAQECEAEIFVFELYAAGVGQTLTPPSSAEAAQHAPVTFAGETAPIERSSGRKEAVALSFEIASSESAVSNPDVDHGAGTLGPSGQPERQTYSFTSTRATARLGTLYWQASFTLPMEKCKGELHRFNTGGGFGQVQQLAVVKAEEKPPPPPPPGTPGATTNSPPTPSGLSVGITASPLVHIGHTAVAYLVDCTKPCSGQTYIKAWQLRGHRKPVRAAALDFGPRNVAIKGGSGGNQRFVEHFRGQVLKKLRSLLRGGHEVKLVVTAKVKDGSGNTVQVQRPILLKG
jgi:hypothetical protein